MKIKSRTSIKTCVFGCVLLSFLVLAIGPVSDAYGLDGTAGFNQQNGGDVKMSDTQANTDGIVFNRNGGGEPKQPDVQADTDGVIFNRMGGGESKQTEKLTGGGTFNRDSGGELKSSVQKSQGKILGN